MKAQARMEYGWMKFCTLTYWRARWIMFFGGHSCQVLGVGTLTTDDPLLADLAVRKPE